MTNKPKPLSADAKTQRAIGKLVEYLEYDEWKDWAGDHQRTHIWHAVKAARDWLNQNA
ncbi:MAG TPA: hypothetical protein VMS82_16550 [Pseudolabrys sp.]|jgi:hypothetical protein|nr:hypothetical protein [Pseudolabrys sp.]